MSGPAEMYDVLCDELLSCLTEIDIWMAQNCLTLNQCKTQLLPVGTWQQLSKINCNEVKIKDMNIEFCSSAKNLGFTFDNNLSMYGHIKLLVGACPFQLQ